jgi:hypothetical protein
LVSVSSREGELRCHTELPHCVRPQSCTAPAPTGCNAGRPVRSYSRDSQQESYPQGGNLEPEEARAVIGAIDRRSQQGERDHALLLFLDNTGARISEAPAVRACDLRLERPRQVRLPGKGRKERGRLRPCVRGMPSGASLVRPALISDSRREVCRRYGARSAHPAGGPTGAVQAWIAPDRNRECFRLKHVPD